MDFKELIKKRRSIRSYLNKEIDDALIQEILEACNLAPSAGNLQAYKIFVIRDPDLKQKLAKAALEQDFIADASVALVFFANPSESAKKYGERGASLYALQDATIAAAYAQLAAVNFGFDTAWVGAFEDEKVAQICNAATNLMPVAIIPIGYGNPNYEKRPFKRKNISDIAEFH